MSERERTPMDRWPDARLLRAAHGGNQKAFETFCVRSLPGLIRYLESQCYLRGVPKDLARDFAQETVYKALDQVRTYLEDGHRPLPKVSAAWLHQIGFNLVMDWLRSSQRAKKAQQVLSRTKRHVPTEQEIEQLDELFKFYTWLPPTEQEMIELVLLEGLDVREAGEHLGISQPAAYKRYERAVKHLQDFIREHGTLATKDFARDPLPGEGVDEEE